MLRISLNAIILLAVVGATLRCFAIISTRIALVIKHRRFFWNRFAPREARTPDLEVNSLTL